LLARSATFWNASRNVPMDAAVTLQAPQVHNRVTADIAVVSNCNLTVSKLFILVNQYSVRKVQQHQKISWLTSVQNEVSKTCWGNPPKLASWSENTKYIKVTTTEVQRELQQAYVLDLEAVNRQQQQQLDLVHTYKILSLQTTTLLAQNCELQQSDAGD